MTFEHAIEPPDRVHALAPHLVCAGAAEAIEFYKHAFGAIELERLLMSNGKLAHASLSINGALLMLVDQNLDYGVLAPRALGGSPVTIHLNVKDVDAAINRAVHAGAQLMMPIQLMCWGARCGTIEDPFGHKWTIATPTENSPKTAEDLVAAIRGRDAISSQNNEEYLIETTSSV